MPLRKLNDFIARLEGLILTVILVAMIVLAFTQVILRNFFNSGITWADPLVRHLVLWVGFIGASVATKEDSHLAIDLVSRFLPVSLKKPTAMFVHAASAVVCGFLAHASYKFVLGEREMGEMLMPGVPTWWAIAIIPVGFGLMSLRFAIRIYHDIQILLGNEPLPPEKEKVA
jgi:TRAP-type C4-dicarboxylate transport system, small permease component